MLPQPYYDCLENLNEYFMDNEVLLCKAFVLSKFCEYSIGQLNAGYTELPTDDGDVYELYSDEVPGQLARVANAVAKAIGKASGLTLIESAPSVHEVVKYNDGASLTMHRDNEGNSVTKAILTLSGTASFVLESSEMPVCAGDLVIMRGRDIVDKPSPIHGTKNNYDRRILLIEPSYATSLPPTE